MGGMKRLLLLLPLVALAGCKDPQDGVKVVVSYTQFVPGCVRVTAVDDASGDKRSTDVAVREKKPAPDGEIVVGILMPEKWGTALTITADAYEAFPKDGQCIGPRVRNNQQGISVPKGSSKGGSSPELHLAVDAPDMDGDGYVSTGSGGTDCNDNIGSGKTINPGATELCNDIDDNCDGVTDEGFQLGVSCTNTANGCTGTFRCAANPQQNECFTPDFQLAWADEDKDLHGDVKQDKLVVCTAALPANRLPLTAPHDDCDDTNPAVHPGAPELCNNIDDNCINGVDEGFNLGMTCFDDRTSCDNGTRQCDFADGGTQCAPPPTVVKTWFPDEDNDSHGKEDAGVLSCPQPDAGYILDAGDCDDGNPFIHRDAPEICDGQDNNCNSRTDEDNVCPAGSPSWALQSVDLSGGFPTFPDGGSPDWRAVSLYGDGGVWIVGAPSARAVKEANKTSFKAIPGPCTSQPGSIRELYSVWAMPDGTAYLGGDFSVLGVQTPQSTTCDYKRFFNNNDGHITTGLFNLATNGGVQFAAVASRDNAANGATFEWDGTLPQPPSITATVQPNIALSAVHGASPDTLFAVGGAGNGTAKIMQRTTAAPVWTEVSVPVAAKTLLAIHVVNSKLAYAVGNNGTLLQWNGPGTNWVAHASPPALPPGETENFSGVLAFGTNSIYITTESGNIYRFNGTLPWVKEQFNTSLYGIAGNNPGDIWVVGRFNKILHYPALPQ
ncbi:putative metal-binding motif-containing protein [Corallococcus sp. Z5C101001]|uniref:putative metal-binding motif-containing protein n=1 Tax=Corallococcus sp. Z5C101001 TaxID=2596829 RepID=UPI00117FF321|nr:putative metal-binding motif-containing protein [Corallococcus sp. Z5C101001]TSC29531.1 hypothetical protein FOF48_16660 [Corallococcus sp. Z5C101001]